MSQHYDLKRFIVRERFRFWSKIKRKPGETPHELAARVRQMATTCDFTPLWIPWTKPCALVFCVPVTTRLCSKLHSKPKKMNLRFRTLSRSRQKWRKQPKQLRPKSTLNRRKSTRSPNREILHRNRNRSSSLPHQLTTNHVEAAGKGSSQRQMPFPGSRMTLLQEEGPH